MTIEELRQPRSQTSESESRCAQCKAPVFTASTLSEFRDGVVFGSPLVARFIRTVETKRGSWVSISEGPRAGTCVGWCPVCKGPDVREEGGAFLRAFDFGDGLQELRVDVFERQLDVRERFDLSSCDPAIGAPAAAAIPWAVVAQQTSPE